jgi:hypothetical protein
MGLAAGVRCAGCMAPLAPGSSPDATGLLSQRCTPTGAAAAEDSL